MLGYVDIGMQEKKMGSEEQMQSIKGQIQQLDEDMRKATSPSAKQEIRERQDELKRQLQGIGKM